MPSSEWICSRFSHGDGLSPSSPPGRRHFTLRTWHDSNWFHIQCQNRLPQHAAPFDNLLQKFAKLLCPSGALRDVSQNTIHHNRTTHRVHFPASSLLPDNLMISKAENRIATTVWTFVHVWSPERSANLPAFYEFQYYRLCWSALHTSTPENFLTIYISSLGSLPVRASYSIHSNTYSASQKLSSLSIRSRLLDKDIAGLQEYLSPSTVR